MPSKEDAVQQRVMLEAPKLGMRLWRNNVGAVQTEDGRHIRFGLANVSKKQNEELKSSDLIGATSVLITPAHVGRTLAVFTSFEIKREGWTYLGTERETAQRKWLQLIGSMGGVSAFINDPKQVAQCLKLQQLD